MWQLHRSQLEKALNNQCMFDGSSIEGFVRIEESDMYLYPDLEYIYDFPMETHSREKLQELSVTFIVQTEHLSKGKTQDTYRGKRLRVQQRWAIPLM